MRPMGAQPGGRPFDTWLSEQLRDLRPSEGAPETLRLRVDGVPGRLGHYHQLRRLVDGQSGMLAVAGLTAAAALAAFAFALRPGLVLPGPGGNAPPPTFDPTVEGPGLLYDVIPTLTIVPGIVALVALVGAWIVRRRGIGGRLAGLPFAGLATVAFAAMLVALHPGFTWRDGMYGPILGYSISAEPPEGSDGPSVFYEAANPGDPLIFAVTITNPGPLPIRLEGIVEDLMALQEINTRWTAMTTRVDVTADPSRLDLLQAFRPVVVGPGQQLDVYLVAKAGRCTYGPGFTLDAPRVGGYVSRSREIKLAYSVFGLASYAPFELPVVLVEPTREDCP